MANFKIINNAIIFNINGNDKITNIIILGLIIISTAIVMTICIFILLIQGSFVLFIIMLSFNLILVIAIFIIASQGIFSRYRVSISNNKIKAYDARKKKILFEEEFNKNKLYVTNTFINMGYVISKKKALVYSSYKENQVHDVIPNKEKTLLCLGNEPPINDLKEKILNMNN